MSAGPCPPWQTWPQAGHLLLRGATTRAAIPVALLVGTLLSSVNEGGDLAAGKLGWVVWVRVVVNYATPFLVASVGYLAGGRVSLSHFPDDLDPPDS